MKPTSTNVYLQVAKKCGSHKGEDKDCTEDVGSISHPNILSLSLTKLTVWGRALAWKRMFPSDSIPGRLYFMARRSMLSHQETNHTSLLLFACLNFQFWTNTLHITLSSRAIKKQLCGPVRFYYACLLPYTMTVSIRNNSFASLCEECVLWRMFGFHLTASHINHHFCITL